MISNFLTLAIVLDHTIVSNIAGQWPDDPIGIPISVPLKLHPQFQVQFVSPDTKKRVFVSGPELRGSLDVLALDDSVGRGGADTLASFSRAFSIIETKNPLRCWDYAFNDSRLRMIMTYLKYENRYSAILLVEYKGFGGDATFTVADNCTHEHLRIMMDTVRSVTKNSVDKYIEEKKLAHQIFRGTACKELIR